MTTDPNPSPAPEAPPRTTGITILLWGIKLITAGILFYASYLKMTDHQADIDLFTKLGMEPVGRYLIGGLEGLAALAILVPQSAIYGAFLGFGIMCGAIIGHLTQIGLNGIQYAIFVALCCVLIMYLRRHDAPFIGNLLDK